MSLFQKGVGYLLLSVLIYSGMPVLIRGLHQGAMPPASQVFLRYIVACLCAWIYIRATKQKLTIPSSQIPVLLLVAFVGYALTNLLYTYAILFTYVGTVLFIFYGFSAMMPLLGNVFLKERITRAKVIALGISVVSLFFLFRPTPMITWKEGALFALLSAIAQGVYVLGRRKLQDVSSSTLLVVNTTVGVISVGLIALVTEYSFYTTPSGIGAVSNSMWLVTIVFGIGNFLAWLFLTRGFQLVSAGTGSLVMLSENVVGVLFAFLFFQEVPTFAIAIGGLLALSASILVIVKEKA
jgi:drug/metabolite transporter (DMT)-like permease